MSVCVCLTCLRLFVCVRFEFDLREMGTKYDEEQKKASTNDEHYKEEEEEKEEITRFIHIFSSGELVCVRVPRVVVHIVCAIDARNDRKKKLLFMYFIVFVVLRNHFTVVWFGAVPVQLMKPSNTKVTTKAKQRARHQTKKLKDTKFVDVCNK